MLVWFFENREEETGKKEKLLTDKLTLCEEDKMKLNT